MSLIFIYMFVFSSLSINENFFTSPLIIHKEGKSPETDPESVHRDGSMFSPTVYIESVHGSFFSFYPGRQVSGICRLLQNKVGV